MKKLLILLSLLNCLPLFAQENDYNKNLALAKECIIQKEFRKAAEYYSKAFASNHNLGRADHRYEAAKCWALAGVADSAVYHLNKIKKFTAFTEQMQTEPSFEKIYKDKAWKKFIRTFHQIKYPDLALRLDSIFENDQNARTALNEAWKKFGGESDEVTEIIKKISVYDRYNRLQVISILDQYGWPGPKEVGQKGCEAVFLVIQHADLATQIRYLPLLKQAVKKKKAEMQNLALLEDRIAVRQGRNQVYGTQLAYDSVNKRYYVPAIEDPEHVDERRLKISLQPMKDYVKIFDIIWSLEKYKADLKLAEKSK